MTNKILTAAGIVTYNPDIHLLERCVSSIFNQVSYTIVVDNGSLNLNEVSSLLAKFNDIIFIHNERNKGIAYALNQIAIKADEYNCSWFLTLDQDSLCAPDMILQYSKYINMDNIGIIVPTIKLRVHSNANVQNNLTGFEYVDVAITSGSFIKTSIWRDVGGFWNDLFIDKVDDDFCFAVRENGMSIIRISEVVLEHEIGHPKVHSLFGKKYYTDSYPPFRYYYIARNSIIVNYCHKKIVKSNLVIALLKRGVKIILGEDKKKEKLKSFLKGIIDGISWCIKDGKRRSVIF